jgi:hypothetical protein
MFNDDTPDEDELLDFCLKFDGEVVTGTVTDDEGHPLSSDDKVSGMRLPIGQTGKYFMNLVFRWDKQREAIEVFMGGFIFTDSSDVTHFNGRFRATRIDAQLAPSGAAPQLTTLPPPDDGDTGTGTGQQT